MLNQQTTDQLRALKLTGMLEAWEQQREQPQTHDLSFDERLALLVEREVLHRENRRLARLLKAAKLRVNACVEDIDYRHPRGLEKARMAALASGDWIRQAHNLCITGPTGCGKTWLACALGNQACRQGLSVRYLRLPALFEQLRIAHGDGSWPRLMNRLLKMDLLILDDWGLASAPADEPLAIDGKTLKGARWGDGSQTHLLTALFPRQGTVLAQRAVEAKHNETPALRELLDPLSIKGRVVTADALHTQRETARFLVEEKGAHYLFTVKDNQKTLANDLKAFDWESIPP